MQGDYSDSKDLFYCVEYIGQHKVPKTYFLA